MNIFNHLHFKKKRYIWTDTVPQIIFLNSLFGYLVILIIYKWLSVWPNNDAPGLLNTMIYMFLSPGTVAAKDQLYPGQVC